MSRRGWIAAALVGIYLALVVAAQFTEVPPKPDGPRLRWGADETGGGPYLYKDKKGERIGFEVELADYLAGQLGEQPQFIQGTWDTLPGRLNRRDFDVVLNGYEWTAERAQAMASTVPYYVYTLVLLARKDDDSIQSWDDLRARPGKPQRHVGVLRSSAAHHYLEKEFGNDVVIEAYSQGVTSAMDLVQKGKLDATVQDLPPAVYYLPDETYKDLRRVGEPAAPGYYVLYTRKDDTALRDRLNDTLRKGIADGTLKKIYEKYDIWTPEQERLAELAVHWPPEEKAAEDEKEKPSSQWLRFIALLARAAWTTVLLSCLAMPLAMLIGLAVAVGRLYGPGWLGRLLVAYVEFLRGTPLLLQLYVIYFVLPNIGIYFDPFWAGVCGLAINYSAYEAENYRAGLLAIPRGQMEAALALGMTKWTALHRVVIPQAVRLVIPPVTNDFIALFKDTSVCSVIAVTELTGRYSELYNDNPELVLQLGLLTGALYLLMSYPLSLVARRLEQRFPRVVA